MNIVPLYPMIPVHEEGWTSGRPYPACPYCGCWPHSGGLGQCPNVAKVEYYPDGTIKSLEKR